MSTFAQIHIGTLAIASGPLAVNINPSGVYAGGMTATITTSNVTGMAVNGSGPFTYAWTKVSGNAINALFPTSAVTNFNATSMTSPTDRIATFRCTITDSLSASAFSDIIVECEHL